MYELQIWNLQLIASTVRETLVSQLGFFKTSPSESHTQTKRLRLKNLISNSINLKEYRALNSVPEKWQGVFRPNVESELK